MADVDFDEFEGGYAAPGAGRMGRWVNVAGAACSLALIAGLGIWGYKLAVRDVSGIPVVRALEGPLRIAPENPGGEVALHQGLSVNAVAAAGTAMPLPEKLTLAPREAELAADDAAGTAVLAALPGSAEVVAGSDAAPADLPEQVAMLAPDVASPAPIEVAPVAEAPAATDALAAAEPLPATQEDAVAAALAAALADDGGTDAAAEPVAAATAVKSIRPHRRPSAEAAAPVTLASADATPAATAETTPSETTPSEAAPTVAAANPAEIDPATIAVGTRLVQLGAFDDEAGARAEWARLQGQFPDLISSKAMVIQSAQSGGRAFFRLRAHGFDGEDAAREFCATLLAENASCIPVAQR